jgi:hypothetical protein
MSRSLDRDELRHLRDKALELRRARLTAIAREPDRHGWPNRFFAPGRTKRGEQGVELGVLANALGCNPQALTGRIGSPLGAVAIGSRAADVYSPALLETLYDHPSVVTSRQRRMQSLRDAERFDEVRVPLAETQFDSLRYVTVWNFRTITERASLPLDTLTVLIGKNAAGKSSLVDAIRLGLTPASEATAVPYQGLPAFEFIVTGTPPINDRSAHEIAAYAAIGLADEMAAVLIPIAAQLLEHPTLIGKPGEWYAALCPKHLTVAAEAVQAQLHATDSKSRFVAELLSAAVGAETEPPYAAVRRLRSKTPPISFTTLGAQESIGERLFALLPKISKLHLRVRTAHFEDTDPSDRDTDSDENTQYEEGRDPDEVGAELAMLLQQLNERLAIRQRPTAGTATFRWTNSDGDVVLPARATYIEVAVATAATRTWRLAITAADEIRSLLNELEELQSGDDAVPLGLEQVLLTLSQLAGLWGPSREMSSWFSEEPGERRQTLACLYLVETIANELAPDFIAEAGRITLLPPQHPGTNVVGLGVVGDDGSFTGVHQLASGIARWVVLLVDFSASLAREQWVSADTLRYRPDDFDDEVKFARSLANRVAQAPRRQLASLQLLLADEPELHLHPAAQEDIARWAVSLSKTSAVLVATHSPAFLRLSPIEASLVRVSRNPSRSTVTSPLDGGFLQRIEALADDIGLGQDRILQLLRGLLVVEGEADAAVVRTFARSIVNRYRLAVVPIGGHSRAKSLAEGDLALAIGLPIAVMFDETSAADLVRLQEDRKAKVPAEVKSLGRVLSLREKGLHCRPIFFEAPDIIAGLPEATVRRRFPKFVSWESTLADWALAPSVSFKNFVLESWEVSVERDLATIEELVVSRRSEDALPGCMQRSIKELEAWAETLGLGGETYA